jgi:hypothetical protein
MEGEAGVGLLRQHITVHQDTLRPFQLGDELQRDGGRVLGIHCRDVVPQRLERVLLSTSDARCVMHNTRYAAEC